MFCVLLGLAKEIGQRDIVVIGQLGNHLDGRVPLAALDLADGFKGLKKSSDNPTPSSSPRTG